jgi:hypothetical protein
LHERGGDEARFNALPTTAVHVELERRGEMKTRTLTVLVTALLLLATASAVWAAKPTEFDANGNEKGWERTSCTTIQSGEITDSVGNPVTVGYDGFGYNYQAHIFNGRYCDYDRVIGGEYCDVELVMKWNDPWLSNVDCDLDGKLDRHYGFASYIGSGAWETNHQRGSWEENGTICEWDYFVKIVAMPSPDGCPEGSPAIWGQFCIIQQVYNSPCEGAEGIELLVTPAGFGAY